MVATQPLVVIVGETASGKSILAMNLALRFNAEIVCADAMTVRRGIDIGTAKPSLEDQAKIPHHLLDVVEPCGDFTAAVFKRLANQAIHDIHTRGKLPIIVGGTGLYIDSVVFDYGFLPAGDRTARQKLDEMSITSLRDLIGQKGLDDSKVDVRNKRRLIRLIENEGRQPTRQPMRPNTLLLGLSVSREQLRERVAQRVEMMLAHGLEEEVKNLMSTYGWHCEALRGIGYREWHEYFEAGQTVEQTKQRIIQSSMNLAKKQRTWFKRNKSIQWLNDPREAVDIVTTFLNTND